MTISLDNAVVYDIETFPNVFTLNMHMLHQDVKCTWEISHYRDDRRELFEWFEHLRRNQIPMIGFFSLEFDYIICHYLYHNPQATVEQIFQKVQAVFSSFNRFEHMIWQSDRIAPQIDLFKINHFDNKAKRTSLKALEINMRSPNVVDMPVEVGTLLSVEEVNKLLIPYNNNDTLETKRFAHHCMRAIEFRIGLMEQLRGDVLNFSDVKIGAEMLIQRIGDDICYDRSSGRKTPRQTIRNRIPLNDIIFPYIKFNNLEFARVLSWMKQQTLTPEDLDDPDAVVKTKGVFKGVTAHVGGVDFVFGTGGMHASVPAQRIVATDEWLIRDIDVESYYPSVAVVNRLAPEHLGEAYTREYAKIKPERREWQTKKGKKCVEANALKLAQNGPWGQSNNAYTVFFDSKYAMTIPINGQLMLCMLAEWLLAVPTFQIIQANTDGITYRIHRDYEPQAAAICKQWEQYTCLTLEDANYNRMWIRDVNNYIAEDMKGNLKQKGAYWHPDPLRYADSISESQPPAWHKDLGNCISIRAAVAAMVHNVNPELFIRAHNDPFDFMLQIKVGKQDNLMLGDREIQRTSRYYISTDGEPLRKISPPVKGANVGDYKRASKVSEPLWTQVNNELIAAGRAGDHDPRIHTKNKSKHTIRETSVQAGWKVTECNNAANFRFDNIDYKFYVNEAAKLII